MILAVDAGSAGERAAEHLALTLVERLGAPAPDLVVSTHPVRVGHPHDAVSLSWTGPADPATWVARVRDALPDGADAAVVATGPGSDSPVTSGTSSALDGALVALATRTLGTDGRLVRFPGQEHLRGTVAVAEVVRLSVVEEAVLVGGGRPEPTDLIATRDHVRPVWRAGRIVLQVERTAGGLLRPFEEEHQRYCCRDHR